jgi:hypothetical protein
MRLWSRALTFGTTTIARAAFRDFGAERPFVRVPLKDGYPVYGMGKMAPMNDALAGQYGERPQQHLVDGGFVKFDDIETLAGNGVEVFAPVPKPRDDSRARPARRRRSRRGRVAQANGRASTRASGGIGQ